MKRLSIWDVLISVIVLVTVFVTLAPAVGRLQRPLNDSQCQANMKHWSQAMLIYAEENDGRLPTSRMRVGSVLGAITKTGILTPQGAINQTGNPIRFMYSFNWVESLYPYVLKTGNKTGRDFNAWMKCPNALDVCYPMNDLRSRMTYAFNFNLVEYWTNLVRNPQKVMMLREMDRKMGAVLRPTNASVGASIVPMDAFLHGRDGSMYGAVPAQYNDTGKLHNNGSNIAFADGHIRYFDIKYYPSNLDITSTSCYDPQTRQWWNYVNNADPALNKVIAITP